MAYYDIGASYSKKFGVCNYLLNCILAVSGTKDYTYTATKEVRLIITMSSRNITTASVKKIMLTFKN